MNRLLWHLPGRLHDLAARLTGWRLLRTVTHETWTDDGETLRRTIHSVDYFWTRTL